MDGTLSANAQLLTPGSDPVSGDTGAYLDLVFARAGDDVLSVYDPGLDDGRTPGIDVLFGDLFDNSPEEFGVILRIGAGDAFAILDANIPSVGSDRFVLGDQFLTYYAAPDPLSLLTTDPLGFNQFAIVYDFVPGADTIQLNGSPEDYILFEVNDLDVAGIGSLSGSFSGEVLFSVKQGIPDLVSLIVSRPEVDLDLGDESFRFVGDEPATKPASSKVLQLGTEGVDNGYDVAIGADGSAVVVGTTSGSLFGPNASGADAFVAKFGAAGQPVTAFQFGTDSGTTAQKVAVDAAGNFYVAGSTGGDLFGEADPNASEAYVAKYDATGDLVWGRQVAIPGAFSTNGFGVDVDEAGSVYLSGLAIKDNPRRDIFDFAAEDDGFLVKFDDAGNRQWTTQLDTLFFAENYDLAVDAQGNSYLVGWTQGLVDLGAFGGPGNPLLPQTPSDPSRDLLKYDAWIAKVDTSGEFVWIEQFGSVDQGLEFGWGVDTDSEGNIYVTGWTTGSLGDTDEFRKAEGRDVFLAKFEPAAGELLFAKQIGSRSDDGGFASDVTVDEQDNVFVTGYTNGKLGSGRADGSFDAWVGRFDTEGETVWLNQLGAKGAYDVATGLDARDGKVVVTGITEGLLGQTAQGTAGGSFDAWVAQLDVKNGRIQELAGGTERTAALLDQASKLAIADATQGFGANSSPPAGKGVAEPDVVPGGGSLGFGDLDLAMGKAFDPNSNGSLIAALQDELKETPAGGMASVRGESLKGTKGDDTLIGTAGGDALDGRHGDDGLYGLLGADRLKGGHGDDRLFGGAGDDQLDGGHGDDVLTAADADFGRGAGERDGAKGGKDADTFVFGDEDGSFYLGDGAGDHLLVQDFSGKDGDVLRLSGSASDYRLVLDVKGLGKGTAIYDAEADDLIGVVEGQHLSFDATALFEYV